MKKLIDTCGWIEWLTDGSLASSFETDLKKTSDLIIPTLIQYELYKWICREKDTATALEVIGFTENGTVVPLDTNLALHAAEIAKNFKLAMADAVIYATSLRYSALLVTCNKHFKSLAQVKFFEKK